MIGMIGGVAAKCLFQLSPGLFQLVDLSHVGHAATGREIGKNDFLMRCAENVRAFRHEVNAAKHDVIGFGPARRLLRELERIAGKVGELDHVVPLIVMARGSPSRFPSRLLAAAILLSISSFVSPEITLRENACLTHLVRSTSCET